MNYEELKPTFHRLAVTGWNPGRFLSDLKYLGLTQIFVARETGFPLREVNSWAHGRQDIPLVVLNGFGSSHSYGDTAF